MTPTSEVLVWWIRAVGFVGGASFFGVFIDFLMGKSKQENFKNWLMKWWDRFDDVDMSNFGVREAEFFIKIIEKTLNFFGDFPGNVFLFSFAVCGVFAVGTVAFRLLQGMGVAIPDYLVVVGLVVAYLATIYSIIFTMGMARTLAGFAKKISVGLVWGVVWQLLSLISIFAVPSVVTVFAIVLDLSLQDRVALNIPAAFSKFMLFDFPAVYNAPKFMIDFFSALDFFNKTYASGIATMKVGFWDLFGKMSVFHETMMTILRLSSRTAYLPYFESSLFLAVFFGFLRLLIFTLFLVSYLTRLFKTPLILVWERILESDKPVFTLVFGGVAAAAKIIQGFFHWIAR